MRLRGRSVAGERISWRRVRWWDGHFGWEEWSRAGAESADEGVEVDLIVVSEFKKKGANLDFMAIEGATGSANYQADVVGACRVLTSYHRSEHARTCRHAIKRLCITL